MSECDMKPYLVWTDYGMEGWQPKGFDTKVEALAWIGEGGHGHPVVVTQRMVLDAYPLEKPGKAI